MSWYRDPQLFILVFKEYASVNRVRKEFGTIPILRNDFEEERNLKFSKHLSLVDNKESDFEAFKASFSPLPDGFLKYINSQGLVINWDANKGTGNWSREEKNSPFWSLPGIKTPEKVQDENRVLEIENSKLKENNSKLEEDNKNIKKETDDLEEEKKKLKEALDKRVLELEAEIAILKAEVNRERDDKTALVNALQRENMLMASLQQQVMDLTSKLVHRGGAAEGGSSVVEPWSQLCCP